MVNIDAKVKDSNGQICRVEGVYDDEILVSYGGSHAEDSDFLKHGTYTVIEDIRSELEQQKLRADELENTLAHIKSHLNDLWHNGDATEHEYAYNTLKYIESLQEDDND